LYFLHYQSAGALIPQTPNEQESSLTKAARLKGRSLKPEMRGSVADLEGAEPAPAH